MGQFIIGMFEVFDLCNECRPFVEIGFGYHGFDLGTHFRNVFCYLFEKFKKHFVLWHEDLEERIKSGHISCFKVASRSCGVLFGCENTGCREATNGRGEN